MHFSQSVKESKIALRTKNGISRDQNVENFYSNFFFSFWNCFVYLYSKMLCCQIFYILLIKLKVKACMFSRMLLFKKGVFSNECVYEGK